jgi:EpsI family protein
MMSWPQYIPAGLLAVGAALTAITGTPRPTPLAHPLATTIPTTFLGASAKDIALGADEVNVSGVSDYLNRAFDLGGIAPTTLYVGYHATQQGSKAMHSPTLCLPGSGWVPVDARLVAIPTGRTTTQVNRYVLAKEGRQILVYYWFQGRGRITTGQTALKLNAIKDAFFKHRDEEALVRIVVPVGRTPLTAPVGHTSLIPDSLATQLASVAIPSVQQALPTAP